MPSSVGESTSTSGSSSSAESTSTLDSTSDASTKGATDSTSEATTGPKTTTDSSSSAGESSSSSTGRGLPACPELLWIAGELDPTITTDGPYYDALVALGYDIELKLDSEAVPADAAGKCAVLMSSVGTADLIDTDFVALATPIVTWEPNLFDILGYTGADNIGTYYGTDIEILMGEHPLAGGHVGTVTIHMGTGLIGWGLAPGESIVAAVPGVPSQATIIAFDTGAPMPGIANAPARRVGLPFHNAVDATPTEAALELLVLAVEWATEG